MEKDARQSMDDHGAMENHGDLASPPAAVSRAPLLSLRQCELRQAQRGRVLRRGAASTARSLRRLVRDYLVWCLGVMRDWPPGDHGLSYVVARHGFNVKHPSLGICLDREACSKRKCAARRIRAETLVEHGEICCTLLS